MMIGRHGLRAVAGADRKQQIKSRALPRHEAHASRDAPGGRNLVEAAAGQA